MSCKFDVQSFKEHLRAKQIGQQVVYKETTTSTMDDSVHLYKNEQYPHGTIVMAEAQTKGRGSRNRKWSSEMTGNIYVSVILVDSPSKNNFVDIFTMEVGAVLAVRKSLVDQGVKGVMTKWPNDIWIRGHKVCGAMVEAHELGSREDVCLYVLGIGLNLNADIRRNWDLCTTATSVRCEQHGACLTRELVMARLCENLETYLGKPHSELFNLFHQSHVFVPDQDVLVLQGVDQRLGTFLKVMENWSIQIKLQDGETVTGTSRQLSVRPSPRRCVCVLEGGVIDSDSSNRLFMTCSSLLDLYDTGVLRKDLDSLRDSESKLKDDALLVVGDVDVATMIKGDNLSTLGQLKEFVLGGGTVFCSGRAVKMMLLLLENDEGGKGVEESTQSKNTTEVAEIYTQQKTAFHFPAVIIPGQKLTSRVDDEIWARFEDGSPAVIQRKYNNGKVCYCLPSLDVTYCDCEDPVVMETLRKHVFDRDLFLQDVFSHLTN